MSAGCGRNGGVRGRVQTSEGGEYRFNPPNFFVVLGTGQRQFGGLLTCDKIAAAIPAVTPLPSVIPHLLASLKFAFCSLVMLLYTSSWQNSLTVN